MNGQMSRTPMDASRTDTPTPFRGVLSSCPVTEAEKVRQAPKASPSQCFGSPAAIAPRLVNMRQCAVILGVSYWTLRDWILAGLIPVVELPPLRPREGEQARKTLRRVLVDLDDLDQFIASRKHRDARDSESGARQIEAGMTGRNRATVPALCPREGAQKPEIRP